MFLIDIKPKEFVITVVENGGTLTCVPDSYKSQKMCNQTIDDYLDESKCVPDCYKTQKLCDKSVDTYPFAIKFVPKCFQNQKNV